MPSVSPPAAGPAVPGKAARLPRLLANTGWNLAGQLVPLLVGIVVLPLLIRTIGLDRYGFITLVWVLVGYASIFDFGIARVLVRVVAQRLATGDVPGAHHVARVGLSLLGLFGLAVALAFALGSSWLTHHVVKLPSELHGEALHAMWLLAASLPFVMLTSGYAGVLNAHQHFRGVNLVRALMGIASYGGPLLVALWVNRLDALVAFTLLMRVVAAVAHDRLARRSCDFAFSPVWPDRPTARELLHLGGWVSVSNIVSPMLSYLDRLLLGALVPVRMVAFYATPFDLISRIMILPGAMLAALFPSAAAVRPGSEAAQQLLLGTGRLLYVVALPSVFAFIVVAHPGLLLWLGPEFAAHAAPVLQILAVGVFFNILAQAPAMLIQAAGRPRLMALLHLVELPIFLVLLFVLTWRLGIVGTAIAAALRNSLDAFAVLLLARRDVARAPLPWRRAVQPTLVGLLLLALGLWPRGAGEAAAVLVLGLAAFAVLAWRSYLRPEEKAKLATLWSRGVAA